jgi:hypothetical protein
MSNSSAAGFKRAGLKCVNCGLPFALRLAARPPVPVAKLPDPFPAKCPMCQHEATYPKSAIVVLAAV